jgi:hypothetical protein
VTTRGRPAIWWRLLLAVSIIAAPLAITGGAAAATWRGHVPPLQAHIHLSRVPVMAADKLSALGHGAVHRLPGDSATAVATGLIALVWFALATSTRRSRRVVRRAGPVQQIRAPPKRTAFDVPFGPASGRAGRFARSHLAHILPTNDSVCC